MPIRQLLAFSSQLSALKVKDSVSQLIKKSNSTGFSLIELMVTVTIIMVLSTIGLVSYVAAQQNARDSKRKQDLSAISTAVELYYQVNKTFPAATSGLVANRLTGLTTNNFINKLPDGPKCDTTTAPSECYYFSLDSANNRYFLYSRMEQNGNADRSTCTNDPNWGQAVTGGYHWHLRINVISQYLLLLPNKLTCF